MSDPPRQDAGQTSFHIRRAREGESASVASVIERFSPLILAQARYRLSQLSVPPMEPDDLVDEVWARALPRLPDLDAGDAPAAAVLMRFLATTLLHVFNNLVRKQIRHRKHGRDAEHGQDSALSRLPADTAGVITRAVRHETSRALAALLDTLSEQDRAVVVLRAVERESNKEVAQRLGLTAKAVSLRYSRALAKLRARVPGSALELLEPEPDDPDRG